MYGQPPYGVHGYPPSRPQTLYQQQYYQHPQPQPPPPPVYHVDPASFRRDFTNRLSNLTFNSRVHIQDLSLMAQDYPQFASVVAQCIDHHIRQVSFRYIKFTGQGWTE
jgi:pre-mRNA cleavage complex 2 protein Pcf11